MIVVRFRMQARPEKAAELRTALQAVVVPSRAVAGVRGFDIAQDLTDGTAFIATEVFDDREALGRQEELPQVKRVLEVLPQCLAADPEATIYEVSSSAPWG